MRTLTKLLLLLALIALPLNLQAADPKLRERIWTSAELMEFFVSARQKSVESKLGRPAQVSGPEWVYTGFKVVDTEGEAPRSVGVRVGWTQEDGETVVDSVQLIES